MSVGVDVLDKDHQILFEMFELLLDSREAPESSEVVGGVINSIIDYTRYHFAREEKVQEAIGYPGLVEHKALHQDLRKTAEEYQKQHLADAVSLDVEEFAGFLNDWLVNHIMVDDMAFKSYVTDKAKAEEAAESIDFMEVFGINLDNMDDDPH